MARQKIDEKIPDKGTPWENYLGSRVEEYLKEQLDLKAGCFYNDSANNRVLVFADEENRDLYLDDPTAHADLLITALDIPSEYSATIELTSPSYVAILSGTKGQYIEFNFDIVNRQGASVGDDVYCTYTFKRGSSKRTVNARYSAGNSVSFNIDNYLYEGTNTITVAITGINTLAATTVSITYKVINLALSDNLDISATYEGSDTLAVPYTVAGNGMKYMEWFIDGTKLAAVPSEDEIADVETSRTKYLSFSGLASGVHHLQFRAYVIDNDERFYSQILYREFMVTDGTETAPYIAVKGKIDDGKNGLVALGERIAFTDLVQYAPYDITFAVYNPSRSLTLVDIKMDSTLLATVEAENGYETTYTISPMTSGDHTLTLKAGTTTVTYDTEIADTSMNIRELADNLVLDFNATGRSNAGSHEWSYGSYTGTFTGFKWNETSGFANNRLVISEGASFGIDLAPFAGDVKTTGLTFECEFATNNVSDDDAVILNLLTDGVGLKLTASEASLASEIWKTNADAEKRALKTKFKSGEPLRISYVINPYSGVDNHGLVFIYINGRVSGARSYTSADSFASAANILFTGSADAVVELRQLRIYNTALSSANILNNYILYRETLNEMLSIYDANDVLVNDSTSFDPDKLANAMPIMLFTGNIPALENEYQDKKKQVVVDVEYINMQDPTKSFTMTNATLTPQGTSSMAYPKKNFRLYTRKYTQAVVLDYEGNEIVDGLYSFKDGAQPVACWCLKTDYAESSSAHNTGVARLWNKCLYDAKVTYTASDPTHSVSNEYALRTNAQQAALDSGYPYDVRTCVDGFPIMCFYRMTADSDYIFIGKYNFNNDKSTESVFGFRDIEGFDNTDMECWEIIDNSNDIALFKNVTDFDTEYSNAFESRYPDDAGKPSEETRVQGHLKTFCTWISGFAGTEGGSATFATQKWSHLDVYKVAAYYVYLMVFGAVDQTTKNAMLTTEDGDHFYYINYDNDTILGLRNDGILTFPPTIDRQSLDTSYEGITTYAYAGHDNTLWNMLEADTEFMAIVKAVYSALYAVGMNYTAIINMFDNEQSLRWCERVFNQDADYKYLTPYRDAGTDHLEMLQGARSAHRRWWVSKRLALYDSKFVAGEFASNIFQFKVATGTPANKTFSITAGADLYYGWGVNSVIYDSGRFLEKGDSHTYLVSRALAIGDPVSIYAGIYLRAVDIHDYLPYLTQVEMTTVYSAATDTTNLKTVIIGDDTNTNTSLSGLSGLASAKKLEYLDIRGCAGITSLDLRGNKYVSTLLAERSHIGFIEFASGSYIDTLSLPSTLTNLTLEDCVYLTPEGLTFEDDYGTNIRTISLRGCTGMAGAWSTWKDWYDNKTADDADCSVTLNGIDWEDVDADDLIAFGGIGDLDLKGKILLTDITPEQVASLQEIYGTDCFDSDAELWIRTREDYVALVGPESVTEGRSAQYRLVVVTSKEGYTKYSLGGTFTHSEQIGEDDGLLVTTETGAADSNIVVWGRFYYDGGLLSANLTVSVLKATYPVIGDVSIEGPDRLTNPTHTYTRVIAGSYTGVTTGAWTLTGDLADIASVTGNNEACVVTVNDSSVLYADGTLSYTLYKTIGGVVTTIGTVTKTITVFSDDLAVVRQINGPIMTALWNAYGTNGSQVASRGQKIAHENYVTKAEAAIFVGEDFNPAGTQTGSIFYAQRTDITNFDELQYFTGITEIPAYCFYLCTKLSGITWPPHITSIGTTAFGLNKVNGVAGGFRGAFIVPDSVTTILGNFWGQGFTSFVANGVISKAKQSEFPFGGCHSLKYIEMLNVTELASFFNTYGNNATIEEINVPKLATLSTSYPAFFSSADYVPSTYKKLTTGLVNQGTRRDLQNGSTLNISKYCNAVQYTANTSNPLKTSTITVDPENTSFEVIDNILVDIASHTAVLIPNIDEPIFDSSITAIGAYACAGRAALETLSIPSTITSIGVGAFGYNSALKNITLDMTATPSTYMFTGCTAVESIHLGPHCSNLSYFLAQTFNHAGHSTITSLTVDENNPTYTDDGNCIYNPSTHNILFGCSTSTIPSDCTTIGNYAFAHTHGITIPSSITTIGSYTFSYCTGLSSVTLTSVTINQYAFQYSDIVSLTLLGACVLGGNYTFLRCGNLKSIDISSQVTNLQARTFEYCSNVESIIIRRANAPTTNQTWGAQADLKAVTGYNFKDAGTNVLYIPSGATGYSGGAWDHLVNNGGFTISATL